MGGDDNLVRTLGVWRAEFLRAEGGIVIVIVEGEQIPRSLTRREWEELPPWPLKRETPPHPVPLRPRNRRSGRSGARCCANRARKRR